jgi:predicted alpha/beta-hydrolase family hydrolase
VQKRRIVFAHGAGAGSKSAWMQGWAKRLGQLGDVQPLDYPYMQGGRKAPDPLPKLIAAHRHAVGELDPKQELVLAGKSMGSRVGCHVALETKVSALVCFGYPLKGQNGTLRDEVLLALTTPILFVQGTRDNLCPLALLDDVRQRMQAPNELYVVESGDHSLIATKTWLKEHATTQADVDARILDAVATFLDSLGN